MDSVKLPSTGGRPSLGFIGSRKDSVFSRSTVEVQVHVEAEVRVKSKEDRFSISSDSDFDFEYEEPRPLNPITKKRFEKFQIRSYTSGQATSAFQQHVNEIRETRVNWQCYRQGNMISAEDYTYIAKYDYAMSPDVRDRLLRQDEMETGRVFLNLLSRVSKDQTVQYVLTLIDDMLQEDHTRAEIFRKYCLINKTKLWDSFFTFLVRPDPFIRHQAARVISKLACWCDRPMETSDLNYYLSWLREQMNQPTNDYAETAARNLQMLLRMPIYRETFVQHEGIRFIFELLCERPNFQMQYQLIFCLWCISFDPALIDRMREFNKLIPRLCDILSETIKEKVVRIILALFRHLLEKPQDPAHIQENALAMVQGKVLKQLELLLQKKIEDQELKEDVEEINEILTNSVQDLTSLDEYTSELRSGRLEWSPVHRSERFWIENAHRLNEKNYELLKILVKLLETSKEPLLLSVACHDIGEYVRHYPRGKRIIEQLGGKQLVMQLLQHEDPNVRYHSLISLQKIMVHNWEYLGKQLEHDQEEKGEKRKAMDL